MLFLKILAIATIICTTTANSSEPEKRYSITGNVKSGYSQTSGNIEKENYSYGSLINFKIKQSNIILKAEGLFSESSGEKFEESHLLYLLNIYNFNNTSGVYIKGEYYTDIFKGFEKRWRYSAGYLHSFYKKDSNNYFRTRVGYQREDSRFTTGEKDSLNNCLVGYQGKVGVVTNMFLQSELNISLDVKDNDDYVYDLYLALISVINKKLSIDIKYTLTFDNIPPPGKKKRDKVVDTSLVFTF